MGRGIFGSMALSVCIDLRDYDGTYGTVEVEGTFRGQV